MNTRKTKIICTLGPAVDSEEMLRSLILSGMNCARFNFSHGTHESHLATYERLCRVRDQLGRPVAALLDTKGPEIRIRSFKNGPITLSEGQSFTLSTWEGEGDENWVSVTYQNLHNEVVPGTRILIDDGLVELRVESIEDQQIHCTVVTGGPLSNNKSINIPDTKIQLPALTDKDRSDLRFAAEHDFDFVAASFVRKAQDVLDIREELGKWGGQEIRIIAKIENREGVDNFDEILAVAYGGALERCGCTEALFGKLKNKLNSVGSLVFATMATSLFCDATMCDQFLGIGVPAPLYVEKYDELGLGRNMMSRTLEDCGTLWAAMFPWTGCGAYQQGVFGMSPFTYFPFAFVNLLNPIYAAITAFLGRNIFWADGSYTNIFGKTKAGKPAKAPAEAHEKALQALEARRAAGQAPTVSA